MRAKQLLELERLDHVVVGAGVEAEHALGHLVARGEHEDGHGRAAAADLPAHLDAVEIGDHPIEQHQIVAAGARLHHRVGAAGATIDRVALLGEHALEEASQPGVVFDQQHSHGVTVRRVGAAACAT